MKYLILSENKDFKPNSRIETFILLDDFNKSFYLYDSNERNTNPINGTIKRSMISGSPMFSLYLSDSEKIAIKDDVFNDITNLKIKQLYSYTLNDFLRKFQLYEWMI